MNGGVFVGLVAVLQLAAAISYALHKQWLQAMIWTGATLISTGTLLLGNR
jgi:hypothetical protein